MVSSTVIAGAGSWLLVRALAPTGVLDRFGAGRERALV
jgi:energy-coupling factor transport system substrate-specific component